jgi:uncharacterized membrane protein
MGRKLLVVIAALAALLAVIASPSAARAELKFCNQTKSDVNLAIGYKSAESDQWVSEGWWIISPGKCTSPSPLDGVLKARYYYYYADSDDLKWDGDFIFCTSDKKFTINGDKDCKSRGYAPEGFREIDVGEATSKEIDLTAE